jgi:hypothetical protein
MTPRSPRCSVRSRLPGRGKTSAASSTSTSGSTPLHRSSCVCIDHGRRAAVWRDCAGCASDSSGQGFGSPSRCRSSAGTSPGSVTAGRNSKNLSRTCSQTQARSHTCGCSRSSAACTRGCARPGGRTCPSRSTTTEPSASCTTGSASRVAVWALGPSPWCAAPSSSSTSWAKPGAAPTSRALRSTATTSSATRSNCQMAPG